MRFDPFLCRHMSPLENDSGFFDARTAGATTELLDRLKATSFGRFKSLQMSRAML
jgi:hypothetical protein